MLPRFLSLFFLIWLGLWLANYFLPWWSPALVAALCCFALPIKTQFSFLAGALSVTSFWGLHIWFINQANKGLLLEKMQTIFAKMPASLTLLTLLMAFLLGGLGSLTGRYARLAFTGDEELGRRRKR